jgi:hypothetical protein
MLQPKSKLPWRFESYKPNFGDGYDRVVDANNSSWDVMNNKDYYAAPVDVKDMKYIVQVGNNFPKAIGLLNESKSFKRIADYEKWIKKVEEFLKSLEENGE